jgi:hypothetical protein
MFTKTSIALAIIVAICSSAGAATRQPTSNDRGTVLINHCANWDAYGLRCDSAE